MGMCHQPSAAWHGINPAPWLAMLLAICRVNALYYTNKINCQVGVVGAVGAVGAGMCVCVAWQG